MVVEFLEDAGLCPRGIVVMPGKAFSQRSRDALIYVPKIVKNAKAIKRRCSRRVLQALAS